MRFARVSSICECDVHVVWNRYWICKQFCPGGKPMGVICRSLCLCCCVSCDCVSIAQAEDMVGLWPASINSRRRGHNSVDTETIQSYLGHCFRDSRMHWHNPGHNFKTVDSRAKATDTR